MSQGSPSADIARFADAIHIGVIQIEHDRRVVIWNRWIETYSFIPATEAIGRHLDAAFPHPVGIRLDLAIDMALKRRLSSFISPVLGGTALRFYQNRDDRCRDHRMSMLITVSPFGDGGCLIQVTDVTASVLREQVLRDRVHTIKSARSKLEVQAKQLESINGQLEEFAYVVSHDLRHPLRMINGYMELLVGSLGKSLPKDAAGYIDIIVAGAKRMDKLILDLLDYARTGMRSSEFEIVSLDDILTDCLMDHRIAISEAGATVSKAARLPAVRGDRFDLMRLFDNLLGNALKYRAEGRPLTIEFGGTTDDQGVLVWIKDNGIGMDPAQGDRAFRIFQRLVPSTAYEGTGIGLAICRKIAETHGGSIWVEAELDRGCTFKLRFPKPGEGKS